MKIYFNVNILTPVFSDVQKNFKKMQQIATFAFAGVFAKTSAIQFLRFERLFTQNHYSLPRACVII